MSAAGETFATAINCIDGRSVRAVDRFFEREYGMYCDQPTTRGVDGRMLRDMSSERLVDMQEDVLTSVRVHNSRILAVVGHLECAGNPVSEEEHVRDIAECMERVVKWDLGVDEPVTILGLLVKRNGGGKWIAEKIAKRTWTPHEVTKAT